MRASTKKGTSHNGKRIIEHVIGYCKVREAIAEARNDRYMKLHWQSVGLLVMEAFYGADPQRPQFRQPARVEHVAQPKPKTYYQREALNKPLRRVVRQIMVGVFDRDIKRTLTMHEDVLICGHRLAVFAEPYTGDRVRYRRCGECAEAKTSSRVVSIRRAV